MTARPAAHIVAPARELASHTSLLCGVLMQAIEIETGAELEQLG
jgi:hypothetical protein